MKKYFLLALLILAFYNVTFGQSKFQCPIANGLHKAHKIEHAYNPITSTYTKIYYTELGVVKVVMDSVNRESFELHKLGHTVPTNLPKLVTVYYKRKYKRFSQTQILKSTKQV